MLYKYANWKENDKDNLTKKNIQNSKLFFNTPDSFNDPFDTSPNYDITPSARKKLFDRFVQQNFGKYSADSFELAGKISALKFDKILKNT